MLLGAIILCLVISLNLQIIPPHLAGLPTDKVRQANTITHPPLSCSPLHKHSPPPLMYFDRSLSALTSRRFCLWPSTAYLQNFPRGETLTCLTQSGRPISQQHLLLAKDPSPILISNRLGNGNSQRDKTCRLLFSQDSFSAKLTSLPNGASCLCAATTAVFVTACCVCLSLLCFQELAVSSVYVLATKMQKSAVTPIFASLFLSNCFYLCFLCTVCTSYSPHPQQNHSYVLRFSILTQTLW